MKEIEEDLQNRAIYLVDDLGNDLNRENNNISLN